LSVADNKIVIVDVAGLVNVTVPVNQLPLMRLEGVTVSELSSGGPTRSAAWRVVPLRVALMLAVVFVTPVAVVIANVADALPAGTVTEAGTVAAALSEESATVRFVAAAPVSATAPVAVPPAATAAGEIDSDASCAERTESDADAAYWFNVAVIVADVTAITGEVAIVNDALVRLASTVTVAGTDATAGISEERLMIVSTAAAVPSVTVPVAVLPPVVDEGEMLSASTESVAIVATPRPS